jgi:hypothetical protein
MVAGLPSTSAGSNTKRRTASSAGSSKAGPADSSTFTSDTVPSAAMPIWSTTEAVSPAAFSLSGYAASTNVTSFGAFVSRGFTSTPSTGRVWALAGAG